MLRTSIWICSSLKLVTESRRRAAPRHVGQHHVSYACSSARLVNSWSLRCTRHFDVACPQPLDQVVELALLSASSISSTWPLPRTWVKAVAWLFCGIAVVVRVVGHEDGLVGVDGRLRRCWCWNEKTFLPGFSSTSWLSGFSSSSRLPDLPHQLQFARGPRRRRCRRPAASGC